MANEGNGSVFRANGNVSFIEKTYQPLIPRSPVKQESRPNLGL
jgi:hypothetical protein